MSAVRRRAACSPSGLTFGPDGDLYVSSTVFGRGGHLYVASAGSGDVLRYDGRTGEFVYADDRVHGGT